MENKGNGIMAEALAAKDRVVNLRRRLHIVAEAGFDLDKTLGVVTDELKRLNIDFKRCGKAGITAKIGHGNGRCVLLRADMDALPLNEKSKIKYKAENGYMHACGHDMHTAMLLGAAEILKAGESKIHGTVKLMLQPAEEILEGALNMIKDGALDDPKPDCAIMLHVISGKGLESGKLIIPSGGIGAPAAQYFRITVRGKGCHGSSPTDGRDSLTVAARILLGMEEIQARELSLKEQAVITVGKLTAGTVANAIADTAVMEGSVRAYDDGLMDKIKERIKEIATCVSDGYHTVCDVEYTHSCPTFVNDAYLSQQIYGYACELLGKENVILTSERGGGSEDFSYVSQLIPTAMVALPASSIDAYPLHHPGVVFDERALPLGVSAYAYFALRMTEKI